MYTINDFQHLPFDPLPDVGLPSAMVLVELFLGSAGTTTGFDGLEIAAVLQ